MKRLIYIKSLILIALLSICSCNKKILDYSDPNSINTDSYFNTPDQIQQAAIAIYSGFFYNSMFGWRWEEMFDALANELNPQPPSLGNEANVVQFWLYQYNSSNNCISGYWDLLYRMILRSNLTIDKGNLYLKNKGSNDEVSKAIGDAYFLRGWAYTQLAFYWGRVPIRTSYDQTGNEDEPRAASAADVWAVAESDLKNAELLLPAAWDPANLGRATAGAAAGFLGKLFLYNNQYDSADDEFAKMNNYSLLPVAQWEDNFGETNKNNQESVFEIQCAWIDGSGAGQSAFGEPEGTQGNPGRENPHAQLYGWNDWNNWNFQARRVADFVYTDENANAYTDPRAPLTFYGGIGDNTWCDNCTTNGPMPYDFATLGYYYKKNLNKEYKLTEDGLHSSNNIRLMRYADVLLMRAECTIKGSNPDVTKALGFINQVRTRVGAFPYLKTYTVDQTFVLLQKERQLELMGEQSRFNDLKRWNMLEQYVDPELQAIGASGPFQAKYYLFPIPQSEIDANLKLGEVDNSWN